MTVEEFIEEWRGGCLEISAQTSGSTGNPKLIKLPRGVVEASARRSVKHFDITENSRLHLCLSADYIAGKMVIVRALVSGAELTWEAPSQTPLLDLSPDESITLLSVVGAQVEGLYHRKAQLPKIKHLLIGGAPLNSPTAGLALQIAENVWESYGMTETASHIALRRIEAPDDVDSTPFTLLPGVSLSTDETWRGIIKIAGLKPLITNDIVEFTCAGQFMIKGRVDNVIITGGKKVFAEQIEKKISKCMEGFSGYFITGVPDDKWGSIVTLVIESEPLTEEESVALLNACSALTAAAEKPRKLLTSRTLQRTGSGKIIRKL